jgi:ribosomal protein S18 acetylase RimI-like enzyme
MSQEEFQLYDVVIRPFQIGDYDSVISLWEHANLPFKPKGRDRRESIEQEITKDTALFYVAEYQNRIIGSIFATQDGRKGWINRLAIEPRYQREGIGGLLISEIEKKFDQQGILIVCCLIEDWNKGSLHFFEHKGYQRHNDIIYFSKRKHDLV